VERLIDPRTLARVRDLPLVAQTVAEGFLHGIQASQQRGVGIEFSQYRAYEPGDDPGRIDWKLYARSDRYFVREAERESEIAVWIAVDCSNSMAQQSASGAWSKFAYARQLAATLAYLAQAQGDLVGLLALSSEQPGFLPPLSGKRQYHRVLTELHRLGPGGHMPRAETLRAQLARLQQPGLILVLSDLHQASDEIHALLRRIRSTRNEVACLQLLCQDELDYPWRGPTRFEDLETGEQLLLSGRVARDAYLANLAESQARLTRSLALRGISLDTLNIDEPMDAALEAVLRRRQQRLGLLTSR